MLQFPKNNPQDFSNLFVMIPVYFRVTKNTVSLRQQVNRKPNSSNAIILPTPSSGINLRESGNNK